MAFRNCFIFIVLRYRILFVILFPRTAAVQETTGGPAPVLNMLFFFYNFIFHIYARLEFRAIHTCKRNEICNLMRQVRRKRDYLSF